MGEVVPDRDMPPWPWGPDVGDPASRSGLPTGTLPAPLGRGPVSGGDGRPSREELGEAREPTSARALARSPRLVENPAMRWSSSLASISPLRVFGLMLLLVFAVESAIMLLLSRLPSAWRGGVLDGLFDATTLTLIVAPAVWSLLVLPLRRSLDLRAGLLRRLVHAQEDERTRVAQDLHDGVGQNLTALLVGLRAAEAAPDLEAAVARVRDLRKVASIAHREVRQLARGLRPILLEELGLTTAIGRLCEEFQASTGVRVELQLGPLPGQRLHAAVETALYRIVQEALANVARHASARNVAIRLDCHGRFVRLSVRDDGSGFDPNAVQGRAGRTHGFGLGSIRERALMLGGRCTIRSKPGEGAVIEIRVPLEA